MLPDRVSNPGHLTYESGALPIALRGPAFDFSGLAIFSNSCHIGLPSSLNFIFVKPCSLVMLHVKFENNGCSGFRE